MKQNWKKKFWAKVKKTDVCWEWQGAVGSHGYGAVTINKKVFLAHRISWILHFGKIPENSGFYKTKLVLHRCDNKICVKPGHLFLGTQLDNIMDKDLKGKHNKGERNGMSVLTEKDVLEIRKLGSKFSRAELGRMFKISRTSIGLIIQNKRWKHI